MADPDGEAIAEEVPAATPGAAAEPTAEEPHRDDGLDLARTIARATVGTTGPARRRRGKDATTRDAAAAAAARSGRRRSSGAHPDDRDPQLLGSSLSRLVADHGWELDLRIRSLFARWEELVGAEVAEHSTPESFAEGRLVVRAHSTAWGTQLRLLAPTLLRRLAEEVGDGVVTVIDVLGPHAPGWTRGRLSTRDSRGPRDTYG